MSFIFPFTGEVLEIKERRSEKAGVFLFIEVEKVKVRTTPTGSIKSFKNIPLTVFSPLAEAFLKDVEVGDIISGNAEADSREVRTKDKSFNQATLTLLDFMVVGQIQRDLHPELSSTSDAAL